MDMSLWSRSGAHPKAVALVAMAVAMGACGETEADQDDVPAVTSEPTGMTEALDTGSDGAPAGDEVEFQPEGPPGTQGDLEDAALASFTALLSHDDQAYYASLSRICRERHAFSSVENHNAWRRSQVLGIGHTDFSEVRVASVHIEDFTGHTATVTLDIQGSDEDFIEGQANEWFYDEEAWRLGTCPDVSPPAGGLEGQGTDRNDPLGYGFVADADGWLISLIDIDPESEGYLHEGGLEPAQDGYQLFSAGLGIYYNGPELSVVLGEDLDFAFVRGSDEYGDEISCRNTEYEYVVDLGAVFIPGDDTRGVICRQLPVGEATGLLLRITNTRTGTSYWFDLSG